MVYRLISIHLSMQLGNFPICKNFRVQCLTQLSCNIRLAIELLYTEIDSDMASEYQISLQSLLTIYISDVFKKIVLPY